MRVRMTRTLWRLLNGSAVFTLPVSKGEGRSGLENRMNLLWQTLWNYVAIRETPVSTETMYCMHTIVTWHWRETQPFSFYCSNLSWGLRGWGERPHNKVSSLALFLQSVLSRGALISHLYGREQGTCMVRWAPASWVMTFSTTTFVTPRCSYLFLS